MPLRANLFQEIQNCIGQAANLNFTVASDASDLFEAYIFCIAIEASKREGATVVFENVMGQRPCPVIFRTSPGRIWTKDPAYTHAVIQFPNKPGLEAHIGVYVSGRSGLVHESDVAVVLRDEATTCRTYSVHPRCSKVLMGIECKFYSAGLKLNLARSFIGLTSDIANDHRFFVANTASNSIQRLLTHHKRKWSQEAYPDNGIEITRLRSLFETAFKEFKAKT